MVPQLQSDLRSAIARIPNDLVANPAGVQVMVDGRTVTLRGAVQDEEEAHTIVGLVRLTPGVGAIKNELAFPR
jgi:osmotically-inducible protein OsmY